MNLLRPRFMILFALILGGISTYSAYIYLEKQKEKIEEPKIEKKQIIVASVDIPVGAKLDNTNIKLTEWPVELIPNATFQDLTVLDGRVTKEKIYAKEAILESKLAPPGSTGGFASLIPIGMRAMTVAVNVVSGVSGFILPGTYVDVVVTANTSNSKGDATSKIILENVIVLAVDQIFQKEDDDPMTVQSVTLLIKPEDTEKLALASTEGKLQLTLRNSAEYSEDTMANGVKLAEMIETKTTAARRVYRTRRSSAAQQEQQIIEPEEQERKVEVIRANKRSEITFDRNK
ncbi:Flp pilus assembly protein CpaB [candidate division KSB1 bacterium]|nr:Flp pilus assembly protein CpaB [candidate division KSB1 bacterium]